jgi:hypothetical protein
MNGKVEIGLPGKSGRYWPLSEYVAWDSDKQ